MKTNNFLNMKTKSIIFIFFIITGNIFSQNISNTLNTGGLFTIKNGSTTYFSLSQSSRSLTLSNSLLLPVVTPGSGNGTIYKGNDRFIHCFAPSGADGQNLFAGIRSGNFTMSGSGSSSSYNTVAGFESLSSLTTGSGNTALGVSSLFNNTTGNFNCAFGDSSLYKNTTGYNNTSFGYYSNYSITTGYSNSDFGSKYIPSGGNKTGSSSFGYNSQLRVSGPYNTSFGYNTLIYCYNNVSNTAFGCYALELLDFPGSGARSYNCAFGWSALKMNGNSYLSTVFGCATNETNQEGLQNTAFGVGNLIPALNTSSGLEFNTLFGNKLLYQVPGGLPNGNVRRNIFIGSGYFQHAAYPFDYISIGNPYVLGGGNINSGFNATNSWVEIWGYNYYGIQVPWTISSDSTLKTDIKNCTMGIDFISKLRPVSYIRNSDKLNKNEYGFIAQEVKAALEKEGTDYCGVVEEGSDNNYSVRYNDLLAPIVKSIQELDDSIENNNEELSSLKNELNDINSVGKKLNDLTERIKNIKQQIEETKQVILK